MHDDNASFRKVPSEGWRQELPATAGGLLEIAFETGGQLEIRGWDQPAVALEVIPGGKDRDKVEMAFEPRPEGVLLASRLQPGVKNASLGYKFKLRVPYRFDVKIAAQAGDIRLEGLEGRFEGKTLAGNLHLEKLQGEVDLSTLAGNALVRDSHLDGTVGSLSGRTTYERSTGDRSPRGQGGRSGDDADGVVTLKRRQGDIHVDRAPRGADLETSVGDVRVRSAQGFVKARSFNGDITVDAVDGWVDLGTLNGAVKLKLVGDGGDDGGRRDVRIDAVNGAIEVEVPDEFAMDVEVELGYTRGRLRRYRIVSDFDLAQERTEEWDDSRGTPRKYLRARGRFGDGRHKVTIHSVDGNVFLRRAG